MRPTAWRPLLLVMSSFIIVLVIADLAMLFGLRGTVPFPGQWGNTVGPSTRGFELTVRSIDPTGASSRVGIRPGDGIDIRSNTLLERFWLFGQPIAGHPVTVLVRRETSVRSVTIVPRIAALFRRWSLLPIPLGTIWLLVFAAMIAWRRSHVRELRLLSLVLIVYGLWVATSPRFYAAPWAWVYVIFGTANVFGTLSVALWAATAGCFASPLSKLRIAVQWTCYGFMSLSVLLGLARLYAIVTLNVDPTLLSSTWSGVPFVLAFLSALLCTILSVLAARGVERQRAIWSLVPPAILIIVGYSAESFQAYATNYEIAYIDYYVASAVDFITPLVLTYVALSRRLLDIGFVLNRAAVFAIVSTIIIGVFVLAEWAVSEWAVSASHTTGAIIGMAVALTLGLSMRYIHKFVDRFADRVFFRKRHEDEAALRRFAHESAYITDRAVLLERTLCAVKEHTGTGQASIVTLEPDGSYCDGTGRDVRVQIDENDTALVALRAWHKPVDLQKYPQSALSGQFAFPMVSRGHLVGVLVCGSKQDSEAYAPDEADALQTLAHGVGSALGVLSAGNDSAPIVQELAALRAAVERLSPSTPSVA